MCLTLATTIAVEPGFGLLLAGAAVTAIGMARLRTVICRVSLAAIVPSGRTAETVTSAGIFDTACGRPVIAPVAGERFFLAMGGNLPGLTLCFMAS
ncbi:MAG: hypothetical protein O3A42_18580 [Actinobacteria bacterium]|nr:hypothetical protein [Actinomycetota bacterium]